MKLLKPPFPMLLVATQTSRDRSKISSMTTGALGYITNGVRRLTEIDFSFKWA